MRVTAIIGIITVALIAVLAVVAQQEKKSALTTKKTASISGILLSKATSKPLSGQHLHLLRFAGHDKKGHVIVELFIVNNGFPRARTSASGEFTFSTLPPGEYVILTGTETDVDPDNPKTYLHYQSGALLTLKVKAGDVMNLGKIEVDR